MSTTTFKAGDEVYNIEGHAGAYVARAAGGHIVEPIYEHEEGEHVSYGAAETWGEVFAKPPTEKLHADTEAALVRLADVRRQLNDAQQAHYAFEREEKARMARLKQHEALAELDRYLSGEITHYVALHSHYDTVVVLPVGETLEDFSRNYGYGLLTLTPGRNWGSPSWSIYYKEKSTGNSKTSAVYPCCGEEEANEKAREILREKLAAMLAQEARARRYVDEFIACCKQFGVEVPQELYDGKLAAARDTIQYHIANHAKQRAEWEQKLAALTPGAAA